MDSVAEGNTQSPVMFHKQDVEPWSFDLKSI